MSTRWPLLKAPAASAWRPYLDGCCVRCALAARAAELTGGPDGQLRAVYEAIVAAPLPYSAHNWLRRSVAARLLGGVASGQLALTHEAPDAHRARRGVNYLRHLLVANGVLSVRDDALVRLEAWVAERLASPGSTTSIRPRLWARRGQ